MRMHVRAHEEKIVWPISSCVNLIAESRTSRGFGGTQYTQTSRSVLFVLFYPHDSSGSFIGIGQPILVPNFSVSHRADILGIGTGLDMFNAGDSSLGCSSQNLDGRHE